MSQRRTLYLTIATYTALVLLALGVRLALFDRYLPLLDYPDESNMFLLSVALRGPGEVPLANEYGAFVQGEWLAGYPPLYPWLGVWSQRLTETFTDTFLFPGDYLLPLRVMSVAASVLTVVGLLALGWSLARPLGTSWAALAGWFAALPYALSPQVIDIGILAIPDSLIPLACVLALLGAVRAIQQDAPLWLIWSLLGAIAAIYLKYSLVVALWPTFCAVVVLVRRRGLRKMLPWLAALALLSAVTAGYLVLGHGALGLQNQEAEGFRESGLANLLSLERNAVNLWVALDVSMGLWLFVGALAAGALGYALSVRRVPLVWLWLLVPYVLGSVLITSSVVITTLERGGYGRLRYMFPAALALSAIWALSLTQVGLWLRTRRSLLVGGLALVTLAFAVPALVGNTALIRQYAPPDTNLLLWQWSDASLPPTGKFLTARESRTHLVWNRPYSGYTGNTSFQWEHDANPASGTPESAFEAGIHYMVVTAEDLDTVYNAPAMDDYLAQLWPLKQFVADGQQAVGSTTTVYRTQPPAQPAEVSFGSNIELIGYDWNGPRVAAGETLRFRPYWQAPATPQTNYSLFVHLYPQGEPTNLVAQFDGAPVTPQRLPVTWTDADERLIGAEVTLNISAEAAPGVYTLAVGLYDFQTGARLPVGSSDRLEMTVRIGQ